MGLSALGPLRIDGPTGPVPVTGRKTRQVLALLALAAPRPLSVDALAARLWDEPPPSAVKTVQAHVSRARSALAASGDAGVLRGGPAGYHLGSDPAGLDVLAVADLRRRARLAALAGDDQGAAELLQQARRLWRGEPECPATALGEAERARWAEEHLVLVEDHLDAVVAAGSAADAVAELEALTAVHPLRERMWGLRMTALYHCGRQADALRAYRVARRTLVAEVGVEPGPQLQALAAAVLDQSLPAPAAPATSPIPAAVAADVPRYTLAAGGHVAYGCYGTGPVDVLLLNATFVPVDAYLEEPHLAAAVAGLAEGRRVIAIDRRGLGLSDPITTVPTVADWVADAVAVLDAAAAGPVHVLANFDTTMVALQLAATHPDRVATVTLVNGFVRLTATADYPYGEAEPEMTDVLRGIHTPGTPPPVDVLGWIAPSVADDPRFRAWWEAVGRRGASPGTAALVHEAMRTGDVRAALPRVRTPALVVSRLQCPSYDPGHGRYLAEHLPDAVLVEYPDPNGPWYLGDTGRVLAEFAQFIRGKCGPTA
jgi:DNA-binding SARP family transcriptional activator/pimeloyl-ACP methyl ester carboxylesterase